MWKQPIQRKLLVFIKIILKVHVNRALKSPFGTEIDVCFL